MLRKYFTFKKNVGVLTFEVADKMHAQLTKDQSSCANNILKRFNAEISNPSQLDFFITKYKPSSFLVTKFGLLLEVLKTHIFMHFGRCQEKLKFLKKSVNSTFH